MKNEVYPHRLTFLNNNTCDICKENNGTIFHRIKFDPYKGMVSCENTNCIENINYYFGKHTKKLENLIELYGEWIYVIRSNGKKESNWVIYGDAYKEKEDGPYWVEVKHNVKNKTKLVTIDHIIEWNKDKLI